MEPRQDSSVMVVAEGIYGIYTHEEVLQAGEYIYKEEINICAAREGR